MSHCDSIYAKRRKLPSLSLLSKSEQPAGKMMGVIFLGFASACKNLHLISGSKAAKLVQDLKPQDWYPIDRFFQLQERLFADYPNAPTVLQQAGKEFIENWYKNGSGQYLPQSGIDFLRFQASSTGYSSVVRGDPEVIGSFELTWLDEHAGNAIITSTTPFHREFEKGLIIGGMLTPGDITYVRVEHDGKHFEIEFRRKAAGYESEIQHLLNTVKPNAPLSIGEAMATELFWKYKALLLQQERETAFWQSTNLGLGRSAERIHNLSARLERLAYKDSLTGLMNRRQALKTLASEFRKAHRRGNSLSLMLLDLDYFKSINDRCGHPAGDEVLKRTAGILRNGLRASDVCGRLGGEEFIIILPHTNNAQAVTVAEAMRQLVMGINYRFNGQTVRVTASIGISTLSTSHKRIREMIQEADQALYHSKRLGRNRITNASCDNVP